MELRNDYYPSGFIKSREYKLKERDPTLTELDFACG